MDAIALLKQNHDVLCGWLSDLAATTPRAVKTRCLLLDRVRQAVDMRTELEEEIHYRGLNLPAETSAEGNAFLAAVTRRAEQATTRIGRLAADLDSRTFDADAKALKELIERQTYEQESVIAAAAQARQHDADNGMPLHQESP